MITSAEEKQGPERAQISAILRSAILVAAMLVMAVLAMTVRASAALPQSPQVNILCVDSANPYAPGAPCTNALTYQSISAAVQAASTGDELRVAAGTYNSEVVSKTVTIGGGYPGGNGGFVTPDPNTNVTNITGISVTAAASLGNFELSGTLNGAGNVTLTGLFTWMGGTMSGSGVTNMLAGSVTTLDQQGTIDGRTVNAQGTLNFGTGPTYLTIVNGGTYNNSGTFNITAAFALDNNGTAATFTNSGVLRNPTSITLQVEKLSDTLLFTNTGNIDIPNAAGTLDFQNGTYNLLDGTTITGAGYAEVGDQTGIWNIAGTVNAQNVDLTNTNGTNGITGTGTLNISGNLHWYYGRMGGSGITNMLAGSVTTLDQQGTIDGRTVNAQGTLNFGTGPTYLTIVNGGTYNNSGTFNITAAFALDNNGTPATFTNSGVLRNPTSITLQVEKLSDTFLFTNTGNIDVPNAAGTLDFQNGTYNLLDGTTITGAGYAEVGDQTGIWNIAGTVNAQNIDLTNTNGTNGITGTGTLNISGNLQWYYGRMGGSGVTNMLAGSVTTLDQQGTIDGRTVNNYGTFVATNSGDLELKGRGTLNNYGIYRMAGSSYQYIANNAADGPVYFNNYGTFQKQSSIEAYVEQRVQFTNSGLLDLQASDLVMYGGTFTQTNGLTHLDGGGLQSSPSVTTPPFTFSGGTLGGAGTIDGNPVVVNNGATVSPGDGPGILTITGDYTQGTGGTLNIELGGSAQGTGYDRLAVSGAATLAGTLNVSAINGYVPPVNSQYTIVTYASHSSIFGTLTGGQYSVAYNPNDVTITVTGPVGTATATPAPTNTHTNTPTRTSSPTNTSTHTSTPIPSSTASPSRTRTPTNTPLATNTPTRTITSTSVPSNTPTNTPTNIPSASPTNTPSRTPTSTSTHSTTSTRTSTATNMPSRTVTGTNTSTPSNTVVPPTSTPCPVGSWSLVAPLPDVRAGAAVSALGNYLYEAGGHFNGFPYPQPASNTAARFDGTTWSPIANLPVAVNDTAGASDGSRFFAIGGIDSNYSPVTNLQVFDPGTGSWSQAASLLTPTSGATAVYFNSRIYLFGSCGPSYGCYPTDPVQIYNIANNSWSAGAPVPQAVALPAVRAIGTYIYLAGGFTTGGGPTAKSYRYDPSSDTWDDAAMADLPATRGAAASAVSNGRLFVFGGFGDLSGITGTTVIYDPLSNGWSSGPDMNVATWNFSGDNYQGNLYVVGGDQDLGPYYNVTARVEKLSLGACSTPTTVPSATNTSTPTPTSCTGFSDVPPGSTFYPYVTCLVSRGIISGYSDCTFRPNNNVTRGQVSKIISLAAGYNDPPGSQIFEDVAPSNTFYAFIQRLASRGFIGGYPCGGPNEPCGPLNRPYFRPGNNATRGQISKIVSNAAGFSEPPGNQLFADVPPADAFYAFVQRLAHRGVMSGYPCGGPNEPCGPGNLPYFRPNNNTTRGQASKIVANTFFPNCQP